MENVDITLLGAFGAISGGFLGAAFGGLIAFVFCGLSVLAGICIIASGGDAGFLDLMGFGAFFGPHISFAGGAGAAAYAAKRGLLETGKDVITPLITLNNPGVLLVGSAFGLLGYILVNVIVAIPAIGGYTDGVALTVVISAVIARLAFGKTGIVGPNLEGKTGIEKFAPSEKHAWLPYQDGWAMTTVTGFFVGGMSAYASYELLKIYPDTPAVVFIGFGISAISLIGFGMNQLVPATHHITLISAVAILRFSPIISDSLILVLFGAIAGLVAAIVGQLFSRFWLIRGDTHIDPPASSIWPITTLLILLSFLFN